MEGFEFIQEVKESSKTGKMAQCVKHLSHTNWKIWVQIPRTHLKLNEAVHIYNPNVPMEMTEVEAGESPAAIG